jgi:hypothetical protein
MVVAERLTASRIRTPVGIREITTFGRSRWSC